MLKEDNVDFEDLKKEHEKKHSSENEIEKIYAEGEDARDNTKVVVSEEAGFIVGGNLGSNDGGGFIVGPRPVGAPGSNDGGGFIKPNGTIEDIVPPTKRMPKPAPKPIHRNPPGLWRCVCGHEENGTQYCNNTRYCIGCGRYWEEGQQEP